MAAEKRTHNLLQRSRERRVKKVYTRRAFVEKKGKSSLKTKDERTSYVSNGQSVKFHITPIAPDLLRRNVRDEKMHSEIMVYNCWKAKPQAGE